MHLVVAAVWLYMQKLEANLAVGVVIGISIAVLLFGDIQGVNHKQEDEMQVQKTVNCLSCLDLIKIRKIYIYINEVKIY